MNELTETISKHNYRNFLWHAVFLALASSFMDVDTIIPSMITNVGGGAFHVGLLVTIMLGGSSISQLFFASYLQKKRFKKKFLLLGINLRILALAGLATLFFFMTDVGNELQIWFILALVSIFSFSGAFANISYVDMMGKTVSKKQRKSLLSAKQVIFSLGIMISALCAYQILLRYDTPLSYGMLFLFASIFLAVASVGFWRIREIGGTSPSINTFMEFLRYIKKEIKTNKKLRNYLLVISTLGNVLTLMAFLVYFSKEHFSMYNPRVGDMLLLKVTGAVASGSVLFYFSKKFKYSNLLYLSALLALTIPLVVILSDSYPLFMFTFFVGGVLSSAYVISISGILLEISTSKNRAIYAGAAGVGSIVPATFSILGGWLIQTMGFDAFFIVFITIILTSVVFIRRLNCRK